MPKLTLVLEADDIDLLWNLLEEEKQFDYRPEERLTRIQKELFAWKAGSAETDEPMSKSLDPKKALEAAKNNLCPYCGSTDVHGDHCYPANGWAWQRVTCNECERSWNEGYVLSEVYEEVN